MQSPVLTWARCNEIDVSVSYHVSAVTAPSQERGLRSLIMPLMLGAGRVHRERERERRLERLLINIDMRWMLLANVVFVQRVKESVDFCSSSRGGEQLTSL